MIFGFYFAERRSMARRIISILAILFNIGLTIHLIMSNTKSYIKYQERDEYVIRRASDSTSDYYLVQASLNDTTLCPRDARFKYDVTVVYRDVISKKGKHNVMFIGVYWLSTVVAIALSVFDLIISIYDVIHHHTTQFKWTKKEFTMKIIGSLIPQFLSKSSFLLPTYLIGVFDYDEPCLRYYLDPALLILRHTDIDLLIAVYSMMHLVMWTLACWQINRNQRYYDTAWAEAVELTSCVNPTMTFLFFILMCLAVLPVGLFGIFVWIISILQDTLTSNAILMVFNFILGAVNSLIRRFR
jgi:hypothetical protein